MVIEPTVPGVNDSCSSPISGRCSWYTSLPIFPTVAEIAASSQMNSATPSRAVIHGTSGTPRPSRPGERVQQVERAVAPELHRAQRAAELDHLPAAPALPQPLQVPVELRGPDRGLEPERDRQAGLPVGAAAHRGVAVLGGEFQRAVPHPGHVPFGDVAEGPEDQREPGVGQVLHGRAVVDPLPRVLGQDVAQRPDQAHGGVPGGPGLLGHQVQVEPGHVGAAARIAAAAAGGIRPTSAWAWASAARICSQAWVRPSSVNSADASGVVHRWP